MSKKNADTATKNADTTTEAGAIAGEQPNGKKGRRKGKASENIVFDPRIDSEKKELIPRDLDGAKLYVDGFMQLQCKYDNGYKKYTTNRGFSNSDFPKELHTTGHGNVCLVSIFVLSQRAAEGDDEARSVLKMLKQYLAHSEEHAEEMAAAQAAAQLKGMSPELLKRLGINITETDGGKAKNKNRDTAKS